MKPSERKLLRSEIYDSIVNHANGSINGIFDAVDSIMKNLDERNITNKTK